ncbi:MAG: sulfatase-like hydrolase/transferase [Thermoanaerobaculia bacterium]|nr:sulfatase-like hydrolase/transferase [Thermoanaerobaculia bacterium]
MSTTTRSTRNLTTALLALFAFASCGKTEPASDKPRYPNAPVILISIDTLRADRLPAYGYTRVTTPALDRFRGDAILYENAYSHAPLTLPSHVSMLTGLLPPEHGVRNNLGFTFRQSEHATLPTLLKQKGYATAAMVSSFVLRRETGLGVLFDDYDASVTPTPGLPVSEHVRDGAQTSRLAKSWVDSHRDSPFFLMLHIYEPHAPWTAPEAFRGRGYDAYDDEVAYADSIVGDFLDHLRATGIYDRAIILVVSDHGEGLGDHGEMQHGILIYREAIHVPLLMKLPGRELAGTSIKAPAQLIDIVPTVTDLVGADRPAGITGASLLSLPASRQIYSESLYPQLQLGWSPLQSMVDERWHFIESPAPELFDVAADPRETKNVIADERRTAAARRKQLEAYSTNIEEIEEVDPETAKKLAALGYVGSTRTSTSTDAPDPKVAIRQMGSIEEGFRLTGERKFAEAAKALEPVVREHPGMIDVWIKLGEVYRGTGEIDKSVAAYREAITRSSRLSPDLALAAADTHLAKGDFAQARSHAELALALDPARARETLARIALVQGNLDVAEREARASMESAGASLVSPQIIYAEILQKRGRYDEALAAIADAERRSTAQGLGAVYGLEFLRGDTYARKEMPAEAVAAYEREIAAFPHNRQAYANLAILHFLLRRPERMRSALEQLVRANPEPQSYELAARTLDAFGDKRAAAQMRQRAGQ